MLIFWFLYRTIIAIFLSYYITSVIADSEIVESSKCSKLFPYFEKEHNIPADTLHSIALKESGKAHKSHKIRVVWPWAVNVAGKSYYFNTKKEAVTFVKKQIIRGNENIDVGCMQINLKHHLEAFNSIDQAFDPQKNVSYGAKFLRSKYDQLHNWHKAIAHYHSATYSLGNKYKQDVVKIANNMALYKASLSNYINDGILDSAFDDKATENFMKLTNSSRKQKKIIFSNSKNYRSNIMVPIPVKTK